MTHNATTYNQIIETTTLKWNSKFVSSSECYLKKWGFISDTIQLSDGQKKQIIQITDTDKIISGHHYTRPLVT